MTITKLNILAAAVVVVLTAAFSAGLLVPGWKQVNRARQGLTEKAAAVQGMQQQVGDVGQLYSSIMSLDAELADFRKQLPEDRQFGEFLNELSENLKQSEIEDFLVRPGTARPLDEKRLPENLKLAQGTVILPVSVSFETSFTRLFEFLKRMDEQPRLFRVESMRVVANEDRPGQLRAELSVQTYHRPAE